MSPIITHAITILTAALPYILATLTGLLALGKAIEPTVAAKNKVLGHLIDVWDTIVDTIYNLLTSKAGLAEDVITLAQSNALKGLVTQLHVITSEPIVALAIQAAITKLPSADQDAVKAIIAPLPTPLTAVVSATVAPAVINVPPTP